MTDEKQREVMDRDDTKWTCVQAYAGVGQTAAAEVAAERVASADGTVPVVCTPSGGAQSVRLQLPGDWHEHMSDDELREAIGRVR